MSNQTLEQLLALANQVAEISPDMNESVKGGGGGRILPTGYAFATLVEYIEFGQQPQEFNGVAKDAALEVQLGFALTGFAPNPDPSGPPLPYANDDGTPYIFRPYPMAISRNEKATAFLLFKALNWKGTYKHFAQLLGQSFLIPIENKPPKDATKKPRSTMNLKGVLPPVRQDPVTGKSEPYPIPPARSEDLKLFLWENPQLDAWNSFFQEGKYDDGNSKNHVQEKMLSATDFHGSPLQLLLATSGTAYTVPAPKAKPAAPAVPNTQPIANPVAQPSVPAVAVPNVPATPSVAPVVATPAVTALVVTAPPAVAAPIVAAPAAIAVPSIAIPVLPGVPQ